MHENLLPLIQDLEQAVERGDVLAAQAALARLTDVTLYSGNEAYDHLYAIESKLARVLFQGRQPAEFRELFSTNRHPYAYTVWEAFEDIDDRINVQTL
jgi:hypothetical protein